MPDKPFFSTAWKILGSGFSTPSSEDINNSSKILQNDITVFTHFDIKKIKVAGRGTHVCSKCQKIHKW